MFFHISKKHQVNFPNNHVTDNFVISLDEGWTKVQDYQGNDIWFKGYLDDAPLRWYAVRISEEQEPQHTGNFCVIKVFDQGLVIRSDRTRSFPIWYDADQGLTNLTPLGDTVWSDCVLTVNNDLTIQKAYYNAVGPIDDTKQSLDIVVDQIDKILSDKVKEFLEYRELPLRVFLSGGIDTALVFSYIQKYTDDYKLIDNLHTDLDYFYLKNHGALSKLWGYTQIHHWKESCYLASGAPGDEFTARSPVIGHLLLLAQGSGIPQLLEDPKYKNCLHYSYFNQEKNFKQWGNLNIEYQDLSLKDTITHCCNRNLNDWQHWHLGRTLTWTPLRDLGIFKSIASLELDDLKEQVMNSIVQTKLIARNNPKILEYLSPQKNSMNYMENLTTLIK